MSAEEKLTALKNVMKGALDEVRRSAGQKIEEFVNIGKDIIGGIKKGIDDAWTGFTTWTSEKWNGLVDGWNKFWGINSPSKLMAEMGGYVVDGLIVGMDGKESELKDTVKDVGNIVKDGLTFHEKDFKDAISLPSKWEMSVDIKDIGLDGEEFKDNVKDAFSGIPLDGKEFKDNVKDAVSQYHKYANLSKSELAALSKGSNAQYHKYANLSKSELAAVMENTPLDGKEFKDNVKDAFDGIPLDGKELKDNVKDAVSQYHKYANLSKDELAAAMSKNIAEEKDSIEEAFDGIPLDGIEFKDNIKEAFDGIPLDGKEFKDNVKDAISQYHKYANLGKDELASVMSKDYQYVDNYQTYGKYANASKWELAAAAINSSINGDSKNAEIQNAMQNDHREVIASIESVKAEVKTLKNSIYDMKLVLDSGILVGGIIDDIDKALGKRAILAGRGV